MNRKIIFAITFCFITLSASSQIIDKIVAVVGDEVVLMSDIETQYLQYLASGNTEADAVRCQIIEDVLGPYETKLECKQRALAISRKVHKYYPLWKPTKYECKKLPAGRLKWKILF